MTFAPVALYVAVCALLAVAAVLLLREGHRNRTRPGHGRTRAHSRHIGTAQQDHNAIKENDMSNARTTIENLWDRATPVAPLLDAYRAEILRDAADRFDDFPTNTARLLRAMATEEPTR